MKLTLNIWRQADAAATGEMRTYALDGVSEDMSFLEMLDVLNEQLNAKGEEPIAFDSDCREGICGTCGLMINGQAHGPEVTTTCQLHMRSFKDGDEITIEPWRADAFPVIKDLVVDRGAFDRIIQQGGFISANTGSAPEANSVPVPRDKAMRSFNMATCIGCGACVAACPNGSASLFMGAKITHLGELPQGQPERDSRVVNMVGQHDHEGFGGLHQHRRVRRGVPQGDPARRDQPAQQGPAHRAQARSLILPLTPLARPDSRPGGPVVSVASGARAQHLRTPGGEDTAERQVGDDQHRVGDPVARGAVLAGRVGGVQVLGELHPQVDVMTRPSASCGAH